MATMPRQGQERRLLQEAMAGDDIHCNSLFQGMLATSPPETTTELVSPGDLSSNTTVTTTSDYEDLSTDEGVAGRRGLDPVLEQEEQENLTELQRFELDKLKLVAVVVGTATPMAMVEDPAGKGHTVKIGTLVGKRFGQVKHIRRGEIVVQEEYPRHPRFGEGPWHLTPTGTPLPDEDKASSN